MRINWAYCARCTEVGEMAKRKNLQAQRRAKDRYRKRLFIEKIEEWEELGRNPDKMPTLKVYFSELEYVLRDHRLTDQMHIYRTGEPWPRKPITLVHRATVQTQARYSVPHVSDTQRAERMARVKGMIQESGLDMSNVPKPTPAKDLINLDLIEKNSEQR